MYETYKQSKYLDILMKIKRKAVEILYYPILKLFRVKYVNSAYGVKLSPGSFNDKTFLFNALGSYGFYYSNYLKSLSHPFIFLDIGANQGLYSLISGKNTFCKTIIALEPVEQIFKILNRNFILNKIERERGGWDKCCIRR